MGLEEELLLKDQSRVRLPTPDEIILFGYNLYVADNEQADEHERLVAQESVKRHMGLEPRDDVETGYLLAVNDVAVAYARALKRHQRRYLEDKNAAQKETDDAEARVLQARKEAALLGFGWGLIKYAAAALLGYVVAQVIGILVPSDIASETGTKVPGFALAALFVSVFRWVLSVTHDLRYAELRLHHAQLDSDIEDLYHDNLGAELNDYKEALRKAWYRYTKEEYPPKLSYENVAQINRRGRKALERRRTNGRTVALIQRILRLQKCLLRLRRIYSTKATPATPST